MAAKVYFTEYGHRHTFSDREKCRRRRAKKERKKSKRLLEEEKVDIVTLWTIDFENATIRKAPPGETGYTNTHFKEERLAWDYLLREINAAISLDTNARQRAASELERVTKELADDAERLVKASDNFERWKMQEEPVKPIDYNIINPGVRNLVRYLNDNGFETTDSGDGVTNKASMGDEALDYPHIVVLVDASVMVEESKRLYKLLVNLEAHKAVPDFTVEATFCPVDEKAVIFIAYLDDKSLGIE